MIVNNDVLADIFIDEGTPCIGVVAALDEDLSGEVFVAGRIGQVVFDNEYDMIVGIAVLSQQLVNGKGISLMTIVSPRGGGTDDNGPAVGDGG